MSFTIMIVDDSEIIRGVLKRTLEMTGIPCRDVIEAVHGKDALNLLLTEVPDVILTDINMPEMNGVELITRIKSNDELNDIPVIVVSTEGSETRIQQLMDQGIAGYLRKPFTPESIREILTEVLGDWNDG